MSKNFDKIAAIEKAITEKYGEEAVQNPRANWDEEREKEYLEQMKEFYKKIKKNEDSQEKIEINGDGETSRDFCYVDNVIQMNILAATASGKARGTVYNVAVGKRTTLNELFRIIRKNLSMQGFETPGNPIYSEFRKGDVRHSLADVSKAMNYLGYSPTHSLSKGIELAIPWYIKKFSK